jgi:hypothetical protein
MGDRSAQESRALQRAKIERLTDKLVRVAIGPTDPAGLAAPPSFAFRRHRNARGQLFPRTRTSSQIAAKATLVSIEASGF